MTGTSRPTARWGATIPLDAPLSEHAPLLRQLEAAGYSDLWSVEGGASDAFTPLAAAAGCGIHMRLATGVVSSFTRGPGLLAQTAAALAELSGGGFALGLGSSSDTIVRDWNGIPFERPLARTRDVVRFLRAAFSGEKVTEDYETFSVRNFRLSGAPSTPPRIYVAAMREQMLRMAAREADGVMVNWMSPADVARVSGILRAENPLADIVDRVIVCPDDDADRVYALARPLVVSYTAVGVYRAFHRSAGRADELAESWAAWDAGDKKRAAELVPATVVDQLVVHGDLSTCSKRLDDYVQSGVDTVVLSLLPSPLSTVEALCELVGGGVS